MSDLPKPQKASEWLLLLKSNPDDKSLKDAFSAWYEQSPRNAVNWQKAVKAYKLLGSLPAKYEEDWSDAKVVPFTQMERKAASLTSFRSLGSMLAIAACLFLVLWLGWLPANHADYVTGTAETLEIKLPDGSQIQLAPESKLDVAFTDTERNVHLIQGHGFFNIAKNPSKPFNVHVRDTEVTVLGTAFDVGLHETNTHVFVKEGVVSVKPLSYLERETLSVGDGLFISTDGKVLQRRISPDYISSWREYRLIVNDRPASEVIDTIKRYQKGIVIVAARDLANQPVTGVYQLNNPSAALSAVARSIGAKIYTVLPWVTIISPV